MKIGDYVRYQKSKYYDEIKDIRIAKIMDIKEYTGYKDINGNNIKFIFFVGGNGEYEDKIIKSSPNIIDLIEVGDYVNGSCITYISKDRKTYTIESKEGYCDLKKLKVDSIVTCEQFESMKYKVGE